MFTQTGYRLIYYQLNSPPLSWIARLLSFFDWFSYYFISLSLIEVFWVSLFLEYSYTMILHIMLSHLLMILYYAFCLFLVINTLLCIDISNYFNSLFLIEVSGWVYFSSIFILWLYILCYRICWWFYFMPSAYSWW